MVGAEQGDVLMKQGCEVSSIWDELEVRLVEERLNNGGFGFKALNSWVS